MILNSFTAYFINLFNMSGIKSKIIFVLGGPGAGKGSICKNLIKDYGFQHLSAGDLLREERSNPGSEYGELIEGHIKNGTIVPVEITCKLIEKAMQISNTNKFLIDGFPRNKDNLDGWLREMSDKTQLLFVLYLECPTDICAQRCLGRGSEGSGRSDDNIESIKKRIVTFNNDTMPIIQYYEKQNLVKKIDSSKPFDVVYEEVKKAIINTVD